MLEISDILTLYEENVKIKLSEKVPKEDPSRKGLWDPGKNSIDVYMKNIESKEDFELTLIHEFLHAKEDYLYGNPGKEKDILLLERRSYENSPWLPKFIIDFYKLNVPNKYK